MKLRRTVQVLAAGVAATIAAGGSARSQCAEWSSGFHMPGVDGAVNAVAVFDDGSGPALYVGGSFEYAGGVPALSIAKWDGASWSALGTGLGSGDFPWVKALAVWDDGNGPALYVGGSFSAAGGVAANSIARWNGASWSSVGAGVLGGNPPVTALTVFDDGNGEKLYVGGHFETAGGVPMNHVARWNGASWSALGAGLTWSVNPLGTEIASFEVFDDGSGPALYAAGNFDLSGGAAVGPIARWDGGSWSSVGASFATAVNALEVFDYGSGPSLYAAGLFTLGVSEGVARWNGTSWTGVGFGVPGTSNCPIEALHGYDDGSGPALYVGGEFHPAPCSTLYESVARWNGSTWSSVGVGIGHGTVNAFTEFDSNAGTMLVAVGNFTGAGGPANQSVASWSGSSWDAFGDGRGVLKYVRVMTAALATPDVGTNMYAGGFFTGIPNSDANGIARWDGNQWWPLGSGMNNGVVALKLWNDGNGLALYAGGYFTTAGGVQAKHVAKWNGTSWSNVGAGFNAAVHALTEFDDGTGDALYAAGHFVGNVARWNGASWDIVGGGMNADVFDIVVFDDGSGPALYAAGEFSTAGGIDAVRVAKWDGTSWSPLGAGFGGGPYSVCRALAVFDDGSGPALYACGKSTARIERWDGANWIPVGGGLDNEAHAMAVIDDGSGAALYVGGDFFTAGGVPARRVAKWDGVAWSALGSGVDGRVNSFGAFPHGSFTVSDVFVGGELEHAGDYASSYIARWSNPCACSCTSYCTSGTSSFGCNPQISATGLPSATASSGFTLQLTGVDGQRISYFFYGINGPLSVPWGTSTSVLCVAAPRQRMGNQFTAGTFGECDGATTKDWNAFVATHSGALGYPFSVGQEVRAQAWYRDPPSAKSTGLSNGLLFTTVP